MFDARRGLEQLSVKSMPRKSIQKNGSFEIKDGCENEQDISEIVFTENNVKTVDFLNHD